MTNDEYEKLLAYLLKNKKAFKLYDTVVKSVSGKTSVNRDVKEYLFPESYSPITSKQAAKYNETIKKEEIDSKTGKAKLKNLISTRGTKEAENSSVTGFKANFGELRDVGLILECTPQLEPDGVTVSIDQATQLIALQGWREYNKDHAIKMPLLRSLTQETRQILLMGTTRITACLFDPSLKLSSSLFTAKQASNENCILMFTSILNKPQKGAVAAVQEGHIHYSQIKMEMPESVFSKLKFNQGKYLSEDSVKLLMKECTLNKEVIVTSINKGISINGNTSITRNVLEAYLPEGYKAFNINNENVNLPIFEDPLDIGSIYEMTPQIDPEGVYVEAELKPSNYSLNSWTQNGSPVIDSKSLDTRIKIKNGEVFLLNSKLKQSGFSPKNNKIVLSLFYMELI